MTLGAVPPTARVLARVLAPIALVVVLVALLGLAPAGAQEDPPITEPPITEPPVTEPPVTEPPITQPPVTEPPPTTPPATPPATTTPTATPAPTSPSPATTNQPASSPAPATTARRGTPTTRVTAAGQPPASTEDPQPEEEPAVDGAEVEAVATTGGDRTRLPLLVAPTTTPGSQAVAVVEAAPVASSKFLPLVLIVGVGLAVLALVLRPARGPRPAGAVVESANPLLLAGPPLGAAAPGAARLPASRPPPPVGVDRAPDRTDSVVPVVAPIEVPPEPDLAAAVPIVLTDLPVLVPDLPVLVTDHDAPEAAPEVAVPVIGADDPRRPAPNGTAAARPQPADDDLPDVASLVEQARQRRRSGSTGPR